MSFKPLSSLRRGFGVFWRAVDSTRRGVLNVLFLAIVVFLLIAVFSGGGVKPMATKTALVLEIKGSLVEQHSGNVREALMANAGAGEVRRSVQLRDVLTVLDRAAKDPQISSVLLLLDEMDGAGLAMLNEVGLAIDRVKASGKPVIAWGSAFDQRQYLLASHATQVYMHPMGAVMIEGFGRYRNYYRDALDKVGVTVNLMKVGTYKSFAEPYIGNGPSPEAAEADAFLFKALWSGYTTDVEKNRKLPAGWIAQRIETLPAETEQAAGDTGKLALTSKLVDGLKTRDEVRAMMITRGAKDDEGTSFRQVGFGEYLMRVTPELMGDAVGVIVASGEISDGNAPAGSIGGLSTANLIRKAREDKQIKAVVLRVDSPGGSAFGSELIRRELELTRAAGKPVVVSMGSVAASGGYWISMASDEVFADRATITGSIGVFAILPTAEKVVEKLGIHTAGVTTTWLADAYNPMRPLDPRFAQLIQSSINHIYSDFTTKAAAARKTTQPKIDEVGQGRVWTGVQAKERGLVDTIGSYTDALKSAAKRAKLADGYRVAYVEREVSAFERVLTSVFGVSAAHAVNIEVKLGLMPTGVPSSAVAEVSKELSWLADLAKDRKPFTAVTHCMCTAP
ncbi:signal peptide peptidase SppA [Massilia pseudoviolaceinigra]|uniref:signal peptide peptidase SppA n=1 Tax=Massilia pseudoviolaceinigra TaxID=3057165 RepID=UPI0027969764|nr:signal peptide peptidase SppA [Massilia sp. CCM 9206]MDQ1918963.1 signal peptide peptidase SppA [Massilia sp. CCM 9206]